MRPPFCLTMKQSSRQSFWGLCHGHSFHIPLEKASAPPKHHHKSPQVMAFMPLLGLILLQMQPFPSIKLPSKCSSVDEWIKKICGTFTQWNTVQLKKGWISYPWDSMDRSGKYYAK
uniref:Uncharacterized protein n=1 Tax=Pipistrellus kuhlii TaxID=59472 RepID=A0A7J8B1J2_PIPKU|nr:hypothetical protein mPipKuh1_007738 [Pipistrellus kuhlii]